MNLVLFLTVLIVSFIVVRIGAVAFELTGLEWSLAKFQALSCFTGTGFTTKESELITGNPQRRRIASALIVFGHAGLVTLIATFANSLRPDALLPKVRIAALDSIFPVSVLPLANMLIFVLALFLIYRIFSNSRLATFFTNILRRRIAKQGNIKRVTFEELVVATGGYGVSKIEICEDSPILNKNLIDSGLRKHDVSVLAVDREGTTLPNPPANMKILLGDKLICFGRLGDMRDKLCGNAAQ
ncbi:MAG: TrkA C-terminal domain-containing protein [Candidatus Omnitrophota bacterium]